MNYTVISSSDINQAIFMNWVSSKDINPSPIYSDLHFTHCILCDIGKFTYIYVNSFIYSINYLVPTMKLTVMTMTKSLPSQKLMFN